ncbi:MAG: penicillin-binding protein [Myxococcota bacterium]
MQTRATVKPSTEETRRVPREKWLRVRVGSLGFLLLVMAAAVSYRAFELQVLHSPGLQRMAEAQYLRSIQLAPKRGTIFDRNGSALAVSVEVDSVWANPRMLRSKGGDPQQAALALSEVLPSIDTERIGRRLASDRYFVWIARHVTPAQSARVRALEIPGVAIQGEARRYYPNRELAAHMLGFANVDGKGIEGIELSFEQHLRGSVHAVPAIRDRRGNIVFSEQLLDDRAAQGDDLILTIDRTIQRVAEREISLAVRTFEARAGSVVVMDPQTGELLAVANYPTFNPNQPGRAPAEYRRNRAVTDRYEPGSTVKPFTIAAAFAQRTVRADQLIDCEHGAMEVDEYTIHDSHRYDELTPAEILAFSSNIGTAKIGASLGRAGLYRALRRFGFGEVTGLPVPGETGGILRHHSSWYAMDAATIPFGQGMSVTTLQLATAMSVLANGGRLLRPRIIRRIVDSEGEMVQEFASSVQRRVVSSRVARLVADMMTAVTGDGGTGHQAAIDGYLVAGKTGTAQKADYVRGGYAKDKWLASFAGFVPAQDPQLVIVVVVDEPVVAYYGGLVAGPVFRRVGDVALQHLGIARGDGGQALDAWLRDRNDARKRNRMSALHSRTAKKVTAAPQDDHGDSIDEAKSLVPDLMGKSIRAALGVLSQANLNPIVQGSGVVISQYPEAGSIIDHGETVRVHLRSPSAAVSVGPLAAARSDVVSAQHPGVLQ